MELYDEIQKRTNPLLCNLKSQQSTQDTIDELNQIIEALYLGAQRHSAAKKIFFVW